MKILFVCHGNINRSAAGEIILKRKKPETEVKSAGLKTKTGRITAKKMRDALQELGYEQTSIKSTSMSKELAEWADIIFYMDDSNYKKLESEYPEYLHKCDKIARYIGVQKIPDPNYEKDNELHKKVIKMLEVALDIFLNEQQT